MPAIVTLLGTSTRGLIDAAFARVGVEPVVAVEVDQQRGRSPSRPRRGGHRVRAGGERRARPGRGSRRGSGQTVAAAPGRPAAPSGARWSGGRSLRRRRAGRGVTGREHPVRGRAGDPPGAGVAARRQQRPARPASPSVDDGDERLLAAHGHDRVAQTLPRHRVPRGRTTPCRWGPVGHVPIAARARRVPDSRGRASRSLPSMGSSAAASRGPGWLASTGATTGTPSPE